MPPADVVAEAVAVLAAEAERAKAQASDSSATTTEKPPENKGWKPSWKKW